MIDNKVKIHLCLDSGEEKVGVTKTVTVSNPKIFPFLYEQIITNGLGYTPVRKVTNESKSDSWLGLKNHLTNMELVSSARERDDKAALAYELGQEFLRAHIGYTDLYSETKKFMKGTFNFITDLDRKHAIDNSDLTKRLKVLLDSMSQDY